MTVILYTGGGGRMGTVLRAGLSGEFERVVLYARRDIPDLNPGEEVVVGELDDLDTLTNAMAGVDVVLHFAGIADEAPFADIAESNIMGTWAIFEAARRAGVRRVVYASSHHIIGGYPAGQFLGTEEPVRPDTYYGLSKVFGEGAARLYHDKWGLEAVCLRIGAFRPTPEDRRHLSVWLSHRDGIHLVRRAIAAEDVGFLVTYGVSANTRSWWNNSPSAELLAYHPVDDAEDHLSSVAETDEPEHQGGPFADPEYRGGVW
ncbi:NAD-dependent epimerase/dehydratase family protein [Janibacter cremeus]|uniref:Uronate dehydrogenase n=1 Tax=Janibacter cremeus TaxID=1285192 RepID=A0A852VP25_9MICO|nr:NAD(P)-dependent oxidoreductase [Janibacter cremeus]NYF97448.1 uronate dehydrogenase [Janibacter cremeus]